MKKVFIVNVFLYDKDYESGYISDFYLDCKLFDQKVKALNYLRDVRRFNHYKCDLSEIIEQDI